MGSGEETTTLILVDELNEVVLRIVRFPMKLTPLGVGCLVFAATLKLDLVNTGHAVGMFILSVVIGLFAHGCVVYPIMVLLLARRNPITYFWNVVPALMTALGTSSSAASLPVTTRLSVERNWIRPHVAKFVLSLGATVNMDGTGLYLTCAAFFLGTIEGVQFTFGKVAMMALL